MADVKESALSAKSDFAYVRALDSRGNSIRISKDDLVSVVGNLLFKLSSETVTNLDSFIYDNKVSLGRDALNSPIPGAFCAICIKTASSGYYRQFVLAPANTTIYSRYVQVISGSVSSKGEWTKIS